MTEKEKLKLEVEIELLQSLPHTHAYTGELGSIIEKSYVDYSYILTLLNEKRALIRSTLRNIISYKELKEGMKLYDIVYDRVLYVNKSINSEDLIIQTRYKELGFNHYVREDMELNNYMIID
jgi:hypothetical protein